LKVRQSINNKLGCAKRHVITHNYIYTEMHTDPSGTPERRCTCAVCTAHLQLSVGLHRTYSHTLRGLIYYVNGSYPSLCWGCTCYKLIRLEKHPRHDLQPPTKPRQRRLTVQSRVVCNA